MNINFFIQFPKDIFQFFLRLERWGKPAFLCKNIFYQPICPFRFSPDLTLPTAKVGGFLLLPLLHWQTPYGTAMSYTVSTSYIYTVPVCPTVQFLSLCRLHLQSFFQNIDTCIRIPVMNRMAFGTLPDTNAQIFYPWISVATTAAGLTARIHRWYSVNFISIPASFIFQHFKKFCPGNTRYRF